MDSALKLDEESNHVWKTVFQETDLASSLVNSKWVEANFKFNLSKFGQIQCNVKKAVPIGTNFLSDVFTVATITEDGKHYQAFVKVLPSDKSRIAAAFIGGYYQREVVVYGELLPKLKTIQDLKNTNIPLGVADAYYLNLVKSKGGNNYEKDSVYVLEDLKCRGFRMISASLTTSGIDIHHARLAVGTYANYHALSIAHYRQLKKADGTLDFPESYQIFRKDINYINPVDIYRTLVIPNYSKVLQHCKQEKAAEWLEGLNLDNIFNWEKFLDGGTLSCILHGDGWTNNVLYRYETQESDEPIEMALVDWQYARCGHPSIDFLYYLFSSTSSEFRHSHFDGLLLEYFTTLKSALKKLDIDLDCEGYSFDQFKMETKQQYVLAMCFSFFILPIILDPAKATDHSLKDKDQTDLEERSLEEDLDEQGTTDGWASLFKADTVISNSALSERLVGLILDTKEMTLSLNK